MFAQQRATQLARANAALRDSLDALTSVPELDDFLGQVMAAITRQLHDAGALVVWDLCHSIGVVEILP